MPLEGPADAEPQSVFACPTCGASDRLENIEREIAEYIAEKTGNEIDSMFADLARSSKSMTFEKSARPKKVYRFIIDYDPRV